MRHSEYIAACTRARAMKGNILSHADWSRITMMNSAEEIILWLKQHDMISASASSKIEDVEKELRENGIYFASALIRFIHGTAYDALKYFIFYYDLMNIETIIYHLHSGVENKKLAGILYSTGRQGMLRAELLAGVTSYPALANSLQGTVLYNVFKHNLTEYEREENITAFVAALELEFMRNWYNAVKRCRGNDHGGMNHSFDAFIKVKVADAMLRMRFNRDVSTHNIDGWAALLSGGMSGTALQQWQEISDEQESYTHLIKIIFPQYKITDNQPVTDLQMMRALRKAVMRSQRRNEFSLDYLISFLLLIMLQTEDLIKTLECKNFGLNAETVTGYLTKEL